MKHILVNNYDILNGMRIYTYFVATLTFSLIHFVLEYYEQYLNFFNKYS